MSVFVSDPLTVTNQAMKWAIAQPLETESQFDEAVNRQLARIAHMRNGDKRRATVLALAEAEITPGMTRTAVFKRPDVISMPTFYSSQKDWLHDPTYRDVIEKVMALYVRWRTEENLRLQRERQTEWLEREYGLGQEMAQLGERMLSRLLEDYGLEDITTTTEDGTKVIRVAPKWQVRDLPNIVAAASKLNRMALDLDTDRTRAKHEVTGADGGPVETADVTPAELAKRLDDSLAAARAKLLAAIEESGVGDTGDDDGADEGEG